MAHQRLRLLMLVMILSCLSPMEVAAVNPGFKVRITESGLDYLQDRGLEVLRKEITQWEIPATSGNTHIHVIGEISYRISNIRVTNFENLSTELYGWGSEGLLLKTYIGVSVFGNWGYHRRGWIPVSDSGSFDVNVNEFYLFLTLRIGMDTRGRPTVSSGGNCYSDFTGVQVKLYGGGASWLYGLFDGKINSAIKSYLDSEACDRIIDMINNDLQQQLAKLKTQAPIDDLAVIDYSLVAVSTPHSGIDTSHKGEVLPRNKPHTKAPYTVPTLPPDADDSRHLFLWITDYFFKTAGYVYYKAGAMQFTLTQDKLPPGGQISLNTSGYVSRSVLPNVYNKYPNMLMEVVVNATAPPSVNISEAVVNASINLDLNVSVILRNASRVYLFTLNAAVFGSTELFCADSRLKWKFISVKVNVGLKRSAIEKFDVGGLKSGIEFACQYLLPTWLNDEGEKGFPLPTGPVVLQDPVLKQGEGYIKLGANIVDRPSTKCRAVERDGQGYCEVL